MQREVILLTLSFFLLLWGCKVILPRQNNRHIELRVAWETSIGDGLWDVYVDTTTGETIYLEQLFRA